MSKNYFKVGVFWGFDIFVTDQTYANPGQFFVCPADSTNCYLSQYGIELMMNGDKSWCQSYQDAIRMIDKHRARELNAKVDQGNDSGKHPGGS